MMTSVRGGICAIVPVCRTRKHGNQYDLLLEERLDTMRKQPIWICAMIFVVLGALGLTSHLRAQQGQSLNLMPIPANVQTDSGRLRIDSTFTVALEGHTDARLRGATERFLGQLAQRTGLLMATKVAGVVSASGGGTKATLVIRTERESKPVQELGEDETYVLEVTASGATLTAPTDLGTLHGLQTLLQLVSVSPEGFAAPVVSIQDKCATFYSGGGAAAKY